MHQPCAEAVSFLTKSNCKMHWHGFVYVPFSVHVDRVV